MQFIADAWWGLLGIFAEFGSGSGIRLRINGIPVILLPAATLVAVSAYCFCSGALAGPAAGPIIPMLFYVMGLLFILPLVLFGAAGASRWTIFARSKPGEPWRYGASRPETDHSHDGLRASGWFQSNMQGQGYLLNAPAWLTTLEDGSIALQARVNPSASVTVFYVFPIVEHNQAAIWHLVARKGTIGRVESGSLFLGTTTYPAVRFQYGGGWFPRTAVIAARTPTERDEIVASLGSVA